MKQLITLIITLSLIPNLYASISQFTTFQKSKVTKTWSASLDTSLTDSLFVSICAGSTMDFYGQTLSTPGVYQTTLEANDGSDSTIVMTLDIVTFNTAIEQDGSELTSMEESANYQWLDCDDNYVAIPGATEKTFNPQTSGNFAVFLLKDGCTAISSCSDVVISHIHAIKTTQEVRVTPNPNFGNFTFEELVEIPRGTVDIFSSNGSHFVQLHFSNEKSFQTNLPNGLYYLVIKDSIGKISARSRMVVAR